MKATVSSLSQACGKESEGDHTQEHRLCGHYTQQDTRSFDMKQHILWLSCSLRRIFVLYVISIIFCAMLFSVLEDKGLGDSLWWACVTSLTIGYGDIYPTTTEGRIVAMIFAHFWIFGIAPLIVSNILSTMIQDRDKFTHEEQEELKATLREVRDRLEK